MVFAGKAAIAGGIALRAYAILHSFDNLLGPFAPVRPVAHGLHGIAALPDQGLGSVKIQLPTSIV